MKKMVMVTAILLAVAMVASGPAATYAEDLSAAQLKALEGAGVPVYPGASYTTGDNEVATIMWFKSKDSPDKIMAWYKENLSDWSEMDVNGSRVIYKGPGGMEAKDLSTKPYIFTRTTDETPGSTDSEITVRIPK
ncbi:hypothetical protein MUP29_02505 [bacterium]|nr:hypothetical protein [bacterium]